VRSIAVCVAAVVFAGCGEVRTPPPAPVTAPQWRSNAAVIVQQLQAEIAATQIAGGTPAAARVALRSESSLYGLLVSYSDFAGCREMVAGAGLVPRSAESAARTLIAACGHLEQASALFTAAVKTNDGEQLLAAGREAGRALPLLVDATLQLKRGT
jgi:hypothetical protein